MGLLDPDERIIFPEDYVKHWTMFDQVCGSGWLIKDDNAADPEGIDFAWDSDLRRMEKEGVDMDKITLVDKVMIVRVRLPWNKVETEWLATEADLEENGEDWEILEIYIRARRKDRPNEEAKLLLRPREKRAYEAAPEKYEVTDKNYLVAWKMSPETREELLR
jgi:DNA modification methylase